MSSALAAASLILKPEGYSEGRLQTLKPIEKLGSELVTNGGFDTDSDWTKDSGWSIENGQAVCNGAGINSLQQTSITTTGKIYKLSFDVLDSNNFNFLVISTNFGDTYIDADSNNSVVIGTNTFYIEPTNGTGIRFRVSDGTTLKIDNVSLKEVLVDGGDFTFTRGSNLSATRVNSAGLIEKGRENLLLQSNQFDTTWDDSSVITLTSGQEDKDGGTTAWKLAKGAASSFLYQSITTSGVNTFSLYAKADTTNWIMLQVSAIASVRTFFDLSNGVLGSSLSNVINATIESVGNGWYRCSFTYNGNAGAVRVFPADGNNDTSGTSGSIYIQDAQLEVGMVATDYIETGASTVKAGILENTPRLDYSGGATEPSLLLEPQRTNLFNSSEYFDNWILQTNVNLTHNAIESPEGLINGVKYNISSNVQRAIDQDVTLSNGNTYTFSLYVKAIVDTTIRVRDDYGGWIEDINILVSDGWQRITSTKTIAISATQLGFFDNSGGDGDRFYFYGAQVEQGSYATSYIPTYGSSETRAADVPSNASAASIIGQTEGTIFIDFLYESNQSGNRFSISDGTATNWIFIATPESGTSSRFYIRVNNSVIVDVGASSYFVDGTRYKLALAYKSGDWAVYGNGTQLYVGTDNIPSFSSPMDTINFKSYSASDSISEKEKINQVLFFDTRISNGNLATLTS